MQDVTVIGAGPAGTSAAIRLARSGRQVRLYEKAHFPRPKLCGGYLSPESLQDVEELDVLDDLRRLGSFPIRRTVIASYRGTVIETALPEGTISISRDVLDNLLLQQAIREGVDVHQGQDGFEEMHDGPTIIATGRLPHGDPQFLDRRLSPWYSGYQVPYVGIQAIFEDMQGISDQVELDLVESGYVGLARQKTGVNVCALTTPEAVQRWGPGLDNVLAHFIEENKILREHLAGARRTGQWMSVSPVRLGIRQVAAPNTFYAGDAACVLDPFAGEGMSMALYSSTLLAKAFESATPEKTYSRLWHRAFDPTIRWNAIMRMCYSLKLLREPTLHVLSIYPMAMNWLNELTRCRRLEGIKQ